MDWNHIIAAAGTLFLVMDPPGNAPVVKSLLRQLPTHRRRRVLARELCFVLILLLFFYFLGKGLLGWMGISSSSLNLSGGIMLFIIAVGMVFPTKNSPHESYTNTELFIVPVTVPIIVGPAAISLVMMQAAQPLHRKRRDLFPCSWPGRPLLFSWLFQINCSICSGKKEPQP